MIWASLILFLMSEFSLVRSVRVFFLLGVFLIQMNFFPLCWSVEDDMQIDEKCVETGNWIHLRLFYLLQGSS